MNQKKEKFASDTSGRSAADWARALLVLLAGLTIAHLGVTLFLLSELGTDTFTVFIQGLSRLAGLTVGTVHVIVLCILMLLMLLTTKGYVKPGTVVCAFCGGPIIDLFTWLLGGWINVQSGMAVRIASMLLGCVIPLLRHVRRHQQQRRHRSKRPGGCDPVRQDRGRPVPVGAGRLRPVLRRPRLSPGRHRRGRYGRGRVPHRPTRTVLAPAHQNTRAGHSARGLDNVFRLNFTLLMSRPFLCYYFINK